MISFAKVISSRIDSLSRVLTKVLRMGYYDIQESPQSGPAGIDSRPIKDMIAIHAKTNETGKTVIIGYIKKDAAVGPGETKTFSINSSGQIQAYIHHRSNGDIEINGSTFNLVRYQQLNQQLQQMVSDINAQLVLIQAGITGVGGTYTPSNIDLDISGSKTDSIKTS